MTTFLLFFLGAAVGSFLGVVADRYKENLPLWSKKIIGGRSRCEFCGKQLRWSELIPLLSFALQRGKCRGCGRRLGWRYPLAEITGGLVFVLIPFALSQNFYILHSTFYILSTAWILVFLTLFLVSLIDSRLRIIPDEAGAVLAIAGIFIAAAAPFDQTTGSFLGHYALLFGWRSNVWLNHLAAAATALAFFAFLILVTRGRGMGGGDMKLAAAIGFVFGWPDILLIMILSFILGSLFGIASVISKKEKLKSKIPFGPFLAAAAVLVFFFGYEIMNFYFGLFGIV